MKKKVKSKIGIAFFTDQHVYVRYAYVCWSGAGEVWGVRNMLWVIQILFSTSVELTILEETHRLQDLNLFAKCSICLDVIEN